MQRTITAKLPKMRKGMVTQYIRKKMLSGAGYLVVIIGIKLKEFPNRD